jgi:hypothetical protein
MEKDGISADLRKSEEQEKDLTGLTRHLTDHDPCVATKPWAQGLPGDLSGLLPTTPIRSAQNSKKVTFILGLLVTRYW